jgi:hypothetical protein
MQKSIDGLLKSLVCQVLRRCPSLISTAFPGKWLMMTEATESESSRHISFDREDFIKAIKSFTKANNLDTKFCFFIDGLDEYDGYDRDIANLITSLAPSSSIKICIASRPHNVFVNTFGNYPDKMFQTHDFTDIDIQQYIKDMLEGNPEFASRKIQDPSGYRLAEYIRREASGVFLWVYLVIIRVLDGIDNADSMSDLQRKLEQLPTDLRALFKNILDSVDEDYHEQQVRMLQVAVQATEPLNLITYSFMDEEDPDFALKSPILPMTEEVVLQ